MSAPVLPLLSPVQQRILTFIRSYAAEHGWAPTVREIGADVNLGPSTVSYQLGRLHEAGWIRRVPNSARALMVLDPKTGGE